MATWKKIITSGSNADLNQITASAVKFPNDSIPIASLAEDAITIAGSSTALGGSITADTIAGQISNDTISGDQIDGGTIGSTTITALAGDLSLGENNITNVGDINADSISVDAAGTGLNIDFSGGNTTTNKITLADNLADALNITEGSNSYIKFTTTNSSEKILVSKDTEFLGDVSGSNTSTGSFGKLLGDASDLSNLPSGYTVANQGNNRIVTSVDSSNGNAEANLQFDGNNLLIAGGGEVQFRDAGDEKIYSVSDGTLGIAAGTEVDITATDIDINGNVDISGNTVIAGDLTVNGTTTTIESVNLAVSESLILLASGSSGANVDAGILVQSGSVVGSGSVLYHDTDDERWAVAKGVAQNASTISPNRFVTTVKVSTASPSGTEYGVGEMWVDTNEDDGAGNGTIYILTAE
tara:strand:- start:769 stop:2004 length:1236 start_codon:yes stop_codon:yes gene_type:complete